jgi:hypothetical protein
MLERTRLHSSVAEFVLYLRLIEFFLDSTLATEAVLFRLIDDFFEDILLLN